MKHTNPFLERDLTVALLWPVLSWSSYSQFTQYSKEDWYEQYVLGKRNGFGASVEAGRVIGERLATDLSYLPEVPRPQEYEVELKATIGNVDLVGHLDGLSMKGKPIKLFEYKTSLSKVKWTAATVNKHEQIDFYCLLLWLNYRIRPEDLQIKLVYIPVKENGSFEVLCSDEKIQIIATKRTLSRVLLFGAKLKKVHAEMKVYVDNHA